MEPLVACCCGLDIHQATVVACRLRGPPGKRPDKQVKTFGTTQPQLVQLRDWLLSEGCTTCAMESTGIYWKPVYAVLEGHFDLIVGNAQHIKAVPGRKTDVRDSEWLADLCRHGLINKSFVPPPPIRALRELVRYRRKLVQSAATEQNRMHRQLEQANLKLSTVMTDVFGVSGRAMLEALLEGQKTPEQMAQLAKGRLRSKQAELAEALSGALCEPHRYLLKMQLERLKRTEADLCELDAQLRQQLAPYRESSERLCQIPGVDEQTAAVILAELGDDMSVFRSAQHVAAWAGLCPGNHESAGKNRSGRARRGNVHLKTALMQAAGGAVKTKGCYLRAKYYKLLPRLGKVPARMAVAHKILLAVYFMLCRGCDYKDLGEGYLDTLHQRRLTKHLVHRLERLGYQVSLEKTAA